MHFYQISFLCFYSSYLYAALRKDYVDAIAGHEAMLSSLVRDGEDAYRMLDESIYTSELGIAFKKGTHEEVAQELTETLEEMRNEGNRINKSFLSAA